MATPAPARRFKVEPIETTTRSSRRAAPEPAETAPRKVRRFVPEPIETTTVSSRNRKSAPKAATACQKPTEEPDLKSKPQTGAGPSDSDAKQKPARPRRRFAPQLIEHAKRSRRAGDKPPAAGLSESHRTDAGSGHELDIHGSRSGRSSPALSSSYIQHRLDLTHLHGSLAMRPSSRNSSRSHSFRVPDLDTIESSESEREESVPPSLSTSPSLSDVSYRHATRVRESVDDRSSGYYLQLAAKAAEKRLRDQALAAFPNDDHHEPVDHFIDAEEAEIRNSARRDSRFAESHWDLRSIRQHHKSKERVSRGRGGTSSTMSIEPPWRKSPVVNLFAHERISTYAISEGKHGDGEMDRMRDSAKPPMLGADLVFPRCGSPDSARFDVTQSAEATLAQLRRATQQSQEGEEDGDGLWHGKPPSEGGHSFRSNASTRPPSRAGLWGGYCTGQTSPKMPSGLLTPRIEEPNPFETPYPTPAPSLLVPPVASSSSSNNLLQPGNPSSSCATLHPDFTSIDAKLTAELTIEEEFSDTFVTQVYNYLSLGYPSIGRQFDDELSKIARIPVAELRQDDSHVKASGYIRLGEDSNPDEVTEESCMRWKALRSYVTEWARQQPRMRLEEKTGLGIGVTARRGSWAW